MLAVQDVSPRDGRQDRDRVRRSCGAAAGGLSRVPWAHPESAAALLDSSAPPRRLSPSGRDPPGWRRVGWRCWGRFVP